MSESKDVKSAQSVQSVKVSAQFCLVECSILFNRALAAPWSLV